VGVLITRKGHLDWAQSVRSLLHISTSNTLSWISTSPSWRPSSESELCEPLGVWLFTCEPTSPVHLWRRQSPWTRAYPYCRSAPRWATTRRAKQTWGAHFGRGHNALRPLNHTYIYIYIMLWSSSRLDCSVWLSTPHGVWLAVHDLQSMYTMHITHSTTAWYVVNSMEHIVYGRMCIEWHE